MPLASMYVSSLKTYLHCIASSPSPLLAVTSEGDPMGCIEDVFERKEQRTVSQRTGALILAV